MELEAERPAKVRVLGILKKRMGLLERGTRWKNILRESRQRRYTGVCSIVKFGAMPGPSKTGVTRGVRTGKGKRVRKIRKAYPRLVANTKYRR
jgi:hypothetical protein